MQHLTGAGALYARAKDVVPNGVADAAGVRKGHEILLINGTSVLGQPHEIVLKLLTQKG